MKNKLLSFLVIIVLPLANQLSAQENNAGEYGLIKQRFESHAILTSGDPLWFHLFPVHLPDLFAEHHKTGNMETLRALSSVLEEGTLSEVLGEEWIGSWQNSSDMFYFYDDNNFLIETLNKFWDAGAWVNESKTTITNNDSGMPEEALLYMWNTETLDWDLMARMTYTYYGDGTIKEMLMEFWMESSWIGYMKLTYSYNTFGVSEIITQGYDFMLGTWVNTNRELFTYNGSGYLIEELGQIWDSGQWLDNTKEIMTYNDQWQHIESYVQQYISGNWESYLHLIYEYNSSGDISVEIEQMWSGTAWIDSYKYLYTYMRGASVSEILEMHWNGDEWENSYRETYTYNPVGIHENGQGLTGLNFQAYPNPFRQNLKLTFELEEAATITLSVYDLGGKKIGTIVSNALFLAGNHEINWKPARELTDGTYLIRFSSGTEAQSFKVFKKN